MDGAPILNGALRVEGNCITEIGQEGELTPKEHEEIIRFDEHVLLPGLINAHCHLDYTCLKGAFFPGQSFTEWIKRLNGLKKSLCDNDFIQSIEDGFKELVDTGTTTVFNVEAMPNLIPHLSKPPIRTYWFLELIDLRNKLATDSLLLGSLAFFEDKKDDWVGGFGLSPHAPYTASPQLYRLAKQCARQFNMPITTHIAESLEEQTMFLYGEGPLYEFLKDLGRDMSDCAQGSALSHLIEYSAIDQNVIAAHVNYLQEYDWPLLEGTPLHIVYCPKCHEFFGHTRFPLEKLEDIGCNIMIGTDSLASNNSLDLRAEIRHARLYYPHLTSREWIQMITTRPAKALQLQDKLGCLKPGAYADLIALRLPSQTDPYEAVIRSKSPPELVMVNGKVLDPLLITTSS